MAEELFCLCHLSVPLGELVRRKETYNALTNLGAMLLHLGDTSALVVQGFVFKIFSNLFFVLSQEQSGAFLLLVVEIGS